MAFSNVTTPYMTELTELATELDCYAEDALSEYTWENVELGLNEDYHPVVHDIDSSVSDDVCFETKNPDDVKEEENITKFMTATCGCTLGEQFRPCSLQIQNEYFVNYRSEAMELDQDKVLDLVIMTAIRMSKRNTSDDSRMYTSFFIDGIRTCLKTFLFLHDIGKKRFYNIMHHYKQNGLVQRVHGNKNRMPINTLPMSQNEYFRKFMTNYAEDHAILLPGRYPGYKDINIRLLPTSTTKTHVWQTFCTCCSKDNVSSMSKSKFFKLWTELTPYIAIMKPMTDLCWTCQKNTSLITQTINCKEQDKLIVIENQKRHLFESKKERDYYRASCQMAKEEIKKFQNVKVVNNSKPCSFDGTIHYSFDYAQQLHYPSDPLQPGPIYFKTPRKCQLFGVVNEAIPRQINYLIDEVVGVGKGGNATVSLVHHFLEKFDLGEKRMHLHADNCSGQNKNRHFIHYLAWRVWLGYHEEIVYSFMIAGHTKFLVDAHFGMLYSSHLYFFSV